MPTGGSRAPNPARWPRAPYERSCVPAWPRFSPQRKPECFHERIQQRLRYRQRRRERQAIAARAAGQDEPPAFEERARGAKRVGRALELHSEHEASAAHGRDFRQLVLEHTANALGALRELTSLERVED